MASRQGLSRLATDDASNATTTDFSHLTDMLKNIDTATPVLKEEPGVWNITCQNGILSLLAFPKSRPVVSDAAASNKNHSDTDQLVKSVCLSAATVIQKTTTSKRKKKAPAAAKHRLLLWLSDTPHLSACNPFLFVVHGPPHSSYKNSAQATRDFKTSDFRLRPRFWADRPLDAQINEYVTYRKPGGAWETKGAFVNYWNYLFNECFLMTLEAKAPLLANRLQAMIPNMSVMRAKRMLYSYILATHATARAREALNINMSNVTGSNPKKRKRASVDDNDETSNDGSGGGGDDNIAQMLVQLDTTIAHLLTPADYREYKQSAGVVHTVIHQVYALNIDDMRKEYAAFTLRFHEALKSVANIVFSGTAKEVRQRRELMASIRVAHEQSPTLRDALAKGNEHYDKSRPASKTKDDEDDDNEEDDEDEKQQEDSMDVENPQPRPESLLTQDEDSQAANTIADFNELDKDFLTCTEVARLLINTWATTLRTKDKDIVHYYTRMQQTPEDIEVEAVATGQRTPIQQIMRNIATIDDLDTSSASSAAPTPETRPYKDIQSIFPASLYLGRIQITPALVRLFDIIPAWITPLLRVWFNNPITYQHYRTSYHHFADIISTYDNLTNSIVKCVLFFVHDLAEKEDGRITMDTLWRICFLEAHSATTTSVFEQVYKTQREDKPSITLFNNHLLSWSPDLGIPNVDWHCAIRLMATRDSHYIQRLNEQVERFNVKHMQSGSNHHIKHYHYHIPPASATELLSKHMLPCDSKQTIYFYSTKSEGINISFGTSEVLKDKNDDLAVWACRKSHFVDWIRLCEFLRDNNATLLGQWSDYMRCRTAVDQSILMATIGRVHLETRAAVNGLVTYLPQAIAAQLGCILDPGKMGESRWHQAWTQLHSHPNVYPPVPDIYKIASCFSLEETLAEFERHPYIFIPHAEALTIYEWSVLVQVFQSQSLKDKRRELRQAGHRSTYIYVSFSAALGGFSHRHKEYDGSNYHLLLHESSNIFQSETIDFERVVLGTGSGAWVPNKWHPFEERSRKYKQRSNVTRNKEDDDDDNNNNNELDSEEVGLTQENEGLFSAFAPIGVCSEQDILNFCERMLILENEESVVPERPRVDIDKLNDFLVHHINTPEGNFPTTVAAFKRNLWSTPSEYYTQSITSEEAEPVSTSRTSSKPPKRQPRRRDDEENFNMDEEMVAESRLAAANSTTQNNTIFYQTPYPIGLAMVQLSIPNYQVIEYCETHGRFTVLYRLNLSEKEFLRINPIRLSNILAHARQHTYCLIGGRALWQRYCHRWLRAKDDNFMKLYHGDGAVSVPLVAFASGITVSKIARLTANTKPFNADDPINRVDLHHAASASTTHPPSEEEGEETDDLLESMGLTGGRLPPRQKASTTTTTTTTTTVKSSKAKPTSRSSSSISDGGVEEEEHEISLEEKETEEVEAEEDSMDVSESLVPTTQPIVSSSVAEDDNALDGWDNSSSSTPSVSKRLMKGGQRVLMASTNSLIPQFPSDSADSSNLGIIKFGQGM